MIKLRLKLLLFLFTSLFIFSVSAEEIVEEEVSSPSNPQQLLEIVKQGKFADSQEQRERERKLQKMRQSERK